MKLVSIRTGGDDDDDDDDVTGYQQVNMVNPFIGSLGYDQPSTIGNDDDDDDDDEIGIGIEIEITQKNHSSRIHGLNFTGHQLEPPP